MTKDEVIKTFDCGNTTTSKAQTKYANARATARRSFSEGGASPARPKPCVGGERTTRTPHKLETTNSKLLTRNY